MLKKLDLYIIKKVLGTYFLSILMIISIAIVIDITEKMDDFYQEELTMQEIIFGYYIHFIPYYINLFSSLFTFISVIMVTSKLAFNSEIIAMLAGGISFRRILMPFFASAAVIAAFTFIIGGYVIPPGNDIRLDFESKYIDHIPVESSMRNVQMWLSENDVAYMERFDVPYNTGYKCSIDHFEDKKLKSRTIASIAEYDANGKWLLRHYLTRNFVGLKVELESGDSLLLSLDMTPRDFIQKKNHQERLNNAELRRYINDQQKRGRGGAGLNGYRLEYQKRFALPFGAFILTLIGVSLASKKVRGGKGYHMFIGLAMSVVYILCTLLAPIFTVQGGFNPFIAIWIPNIVFFFIGIYLYRIAPK